jgi:nucleotide-binding universal stress UspA family protein
MFKKILVCLDGSQLAEKILPYAIEQAEHFDSELVLFRVFSETPIISVALPGMPGVPLETRSPERYIKDEKEVERYLKTLTEKILAEKKLTISYDKAEGAAGPTIIDYYRKHEIELIAIATHGRSGPGRVILGSVADHVIRHSSIPLLLIRPTED